ncbi:50S ribosomal protein L6 [Patescibacteria group bacterium]
MSRIGNKPIELPDGVSVKVEGNLVEVSGPLGTITQVINQEIKVIVKEEKILVKRRGDHRRAKSLHGLIRSLIANMVLGVSKGWEKKLEVHGTGYRVQMEGEALVFSLGFSHPVKIVPEEGIKFSASDNQRVTVSGIDKVLVGNAASRIRHVKPPDAYKGKGIRYQGEVVKLKPGKAAGVVAGGTS